MVIGKSGDYGIEGWHTWARAPFLLFPVETLHLPLLNRSLISGHTQKVAGRISLNIQMAFEDSFQT